MCGRLFGVEPGQPVRGDEWRFYDRHRSLMPKWLLRVTAAAARVDTVVVSDRPTPVVAHCVPLQSSIDTLLPPRNLKSKSSCGDNQYAGIFGQPTLKILSELLDVNQGCVRSRALASTMVRGT